MATTAKQLGEQTLVDLVKARLPGCQVLDVGRPRAYARLGGVVAWSGFRGKGQIDRQRLLWDALRQELDDDELLQIGLILTVTPEQLEALNEE